MTEAFGLSSNLDDDPIIQSLQIYKVRRSQEKQAMEEVLRSVTPYLDYEATLSTTTYQKANVDLDNDHDELPNDTEIDRNMPSSEGRLIWVVNKSQKFKVTSSRE